MSLTPNPSSSYSRVLQGVAAVIAPTTLFTSVAFYFGWSRVVAFDGYFGLNASLVGYSNDDYVLNSLEPLLLPAVVVLVVLIGLGFSHALVKHVHVAGSHPRELELLSSAAMVTGLVGFVVGACAAFGVFDAPYLVGTLLPAAGMLLVAYGIGLRRHLAGDPPLSPALHVLVGLFVALSLFWSAGLYAGTVGRKEAAHLARHLDELPGITLYSPSDLRLPTGSGLTEQRAAALSNAYEYGGLRLFTTKNGKLFLIPDGWRSDNGSSLIVVDESEATVAVTPGAEEAADTFALAPVVAPLAPPVTRAAFGNVVLVGRAAVGIIENGRVGTVTVTDQRAPSLTGVQVSGTISRPGATIVIGAHAACRSAGRSFHCSLDAVRAKRSGGVTVRYRGSDSENVKVAVRVGRRTVRQTLELDS